MSINRITIMDESTDEQAVKIFNIYQFQINLHGTKPRIWRRIQVPEKYSFKDLHFAIQNAMGWKDYHLHKFEIRNPKTGQKDLIQVPDAVYEDFCEIISEDKAKIAEYFSSPKDKAIYVYDFGDGWTHAIILEKILPAVTGTTYPKCLAGKRACPPEDCGGVDGYQDLLEIIADPKHKEYEETIKWLGYEFNPEEFDPKLAKFL